MTSQDIDRDPVTEQPTNNQRAAWAQAALTSFIREVSWGEQDEEEMLGDLLSNLRHLADAQGWDIEAKWKGSAGVYAEELREQIKADLYFKEL